MDIAAQFRKGAEAYGNGDYASALACANRILESSPKDQALAACLNLKALSLAGMGNLVDALACLQDACRTMPQDARLRLHASRIALRLGVLQDALQQALHACELQPNEPANLYQLARVYQVMGEPEKARQTASRCLEDFPGFTECWLLLAELTAEAGDWQASRQALARLLEVDPDHARAWALLASRGVAQEAGMKVELALERLTDSRFATEDRATAAYALGRLARRAGQYAAAFARCEQANSLLASTFPFDIDEWEQRIESNISGSARWLSSQVSAQVMPQEGSSADALGRGLVFVVGMPRSGTSLCEQILSSHPQVAGGGELLTMETIDKCLLQRGMDPWSGESTPGWIAEMRRVYLDSLPPRRAEQWVVTDKTPRNAERLGLILRLFPQAKVIWMMRHPLDTILSCYFQDFVAAQRFSNRLDHAARMLAGQARLLRHWRQFFPQQIRVVEYSQLVQQLESTSRMLAAHIGVEFHPAILEPHLNPRVVRTSSADQVRRPVYTHSLDNWRRYEEQLRAVKVQLQQLKLLDQDGNPLPV